MGETEQERKNGAKVSKHFIFQRKFHSFSEGIFGLFGKSDFIASTCSTNPTFFSSFACSLLFCVLHNLTHRWNGYGHKWNGIHAIHLDYTLFTTLSPEWKCMPFVQIAWYHYHCYTWISPENRLKSICSKLRCDWAWHRFKESSGWIADTQTVPENKCNFWYRISNGSRKMLLGSSFFALLFICVTIGRT